MQGFLQIDNNLALVWKHQSHHPARALVVNVGQVVVVDAVAIGFNCLEQYFSFGHEFRVGHYNFTMLSFLRILVTPFVLGISTAGLIGCGQPGALYLPTEPSAVNRATLPETLLRPFKNPATQPALNTAPTLPASSPITQ
jgi:hypothetical protein